VIRNLPAICPTFADKATEILASLRHGLSNGVDFHAAQTCDVAAPARGILATLSAVNSTASKPAEPGVLPRHLRHALCYHTLFARELRHKSLERAPGLVGTMEAPHVGDAARKYREVREIPGGKRNFPIPLRLSKSMIPKKPASDLIPGGIRVSETQYPDHDPIQFGLDVSRRATIAKQ
jgi:hypothetical protein